MKKRFVSPIAVETYGGITKFVISHNLNEIIAKEKPVKEENSLEQTAR